MEGEQVQETSGRQDQRLPLIYWIGMPAGAAVLLLAATAGARAGGWKTGLLCFGVVLVYVWLADVVWKIADALREAAMPDAFFSTGFIDIVGAHDGSLTPAIAE